MAKNIVKNSNRPGNEVEHELTALVRAAAENDLDAYYQLLAGPDVQAMIQRACKTVCRSFRTPEHDFGVDDLVQEICLRLIKYPERLNLIKYPEWFNSVPALRERYFEGYIGVMARNLMLDRVRRSKTADRPHEVESKAQRRKKSLSSPSKKGSHLNPQELRTFAIGELKALSVFLDSDPESIDSMPVGDVIRELQELGLDPDKTLFERTDRITDCGKEQTLVSFRQRETGEDTWGTAQVKNAAAPLIQPIKAAEEGNIGPLRRPVDAKDVYSAKIASSFGIFFHPNQGLLAAGEPLRRRALCSTKQFHDSEMEDVYDLYNACNGKMHAGLLDIRELDKLNPERMEALNVVRLREVWAHTASGCQTCKNILRVLNTTRETLRSGVDRPYQTENNFENDVAVFENFRGQWDAQTLTDAHPVMNMVGYWAKIVASKHDCASQYADLRDEALLSLATEGNYEGRCSLKGYVMRVLISKVSVVKAPLVKAPRKTRKGENSVIKEPVTHKYVMIDDAAYETSIMNLPDERSDKLADKVLLRIAYDTELREKMAALPDLQRVIVDIVTEYEERLGSRHIAREAAKRLGRKVTRHQVEIALAQLAIVVGASLWRI